MKHFLIYIDILGFGKRAKEEAEKTGRPEKDIRNSYIASIEGRLKELKKSGVIVLYKKASFDSWLLFTDSIWKAFKSIAGTLKAKLPLEVAIGANTIEESELYSIEFENEVLSYLKTEIISQYETWYKEEHQKSVEQTFILLTREACEELESQKANKRIALKPYELANFSKWKEFESQKSVLSEAQLFPPPPSIRKRIALKPYEKRIAFKPYESANFYFVERKEFERILKILKFLEKIKSQRIEYREIENRYVEPKNYNEIVDKLQKYNMVFIVGDAEMGKTYTAVKLLFEFFKEGYEPVYISEGRRSEQWEFVAQGSEFGGKVIYLEDPWGKVEFKVAESFFRDIEDLIQRAKKERCKIVVTSREKIFDEFEKRKEIAEDLRRYVSKLKVNLAYSEEKLNEMLMRYVIIFEPVWYDNADLRKITFEAVGKELKTPMSIKRLIEYTEDVKEEESLKEGIKKAAESTKIAFAREIKEIFHKGGYEKIILLCFPYIKIKFEVAKFTYGEVLKDLGCDLIRAKDFDDLLEEFNEVEVSSQRIEYVHPSYWDAFGYALVDDSKPNNISKKIFSKVLLKLSDRDEAADTVAEAVKENFNKLPENVRNKLLLKLSDKDKSAWNVAWTVAHNFDEVPVNMRNELLLKLSEKDKAARHVAWTTADNFDKINEDLRNELLLKLSKKDIAARGVAIAIIENFNKLPVNVRILLFILSEKEETAGGVAWAVAISHDKLPKNVRDELLLKLSEWDKAAKDVAWVVANGFNKLPEKVRNELLLKLSDKDKVVKSITGVVANNFDKLPENVGNQLLRKLSEKDEATVGVTWTIVLNFDRLPENIRNLLDNPKLQKQLQFIIDDLSRWKKMGVIELISKVSSKINKKFALKVLDKLSKDNREAVRTSAKELINTIQRI